MATNMPTPNEMRRVAKYMADHLDLHSAAGKLLARAQKLEDAAKEIGKSILRGNRGRIIEDDN